MVGEYNGKRRKGGGGRLNKKEKSKKSEKEKWISISYSLVGSGFFLFCLTAILFVVELFFMAHWFWLS